MGRSLEGCLRRKVRIREHDTNLNIRQKRVVRQEMLIMGYDDQGLSTKGRENFDSGNCCRKEISENRRSGDLAEPRKTIEKP